MASKEKNKDPALRSRQGRDLSNSRVYCNHCDQELLHRSLLTHNQRKHSGKPIDYRHGAARLKGERKLDSMFVSSLS